MRPYQEILHTSMADSPNRGLPSPVAPDRRRVVIEQVTPSIDGGRFPIKRTIGERITVEADVFADGHDVLRVSLRHRLLRPGESQTPWTMTPMEALGNDRWRASFVVDAEGFAEYAVTGWVDHFATWRHGLRAKVDAGQSVQSELLEGAAMLRAAADAVRGMVGQVAERERTAALGRLEAWADRLADFAPESDRIPVGLHDEVAQQMAIWNPPVDPVTHRALRARVERRAASFAAWYEMFPRSESPDPARSATFAEAASRLPAIAAMGFDVVYLPPIHPIGTTARKGRNNSPTSEPGEPGSPWAIGDETGGHTAVHPDLGTVEDFTRFVARANALGLEVALDIAFQCSPDHPWVREHPEWFRHRPDGTIKYAENPPKKYQDIFPLNFETEAWTSLWEALRAVFTFWAAHGVRTFRVDNPHTKPFGFWEWVIAEVQREYPDTIFLSEAFTRPKLMRRLAKLGFTQSYTYFTWRNTKAELTEYFTELATTEVRDYMRPNLFANTPDILHEYLQHGGRPAFEVRLILAATLGSVYGIYSGFELAENVPVRPGSEEYLHSEKYEIKPRDWSQPDSLAPLITRLNTLRREHSAFRPDATLRFHQTDNEQIICYSRESADRADRVLIVVNLDPALMQHGWIDMPTAEWDLPASFDVRDELTGETFRWLPTRNYVRLEPGIAAAHVLAVAPEGAA
jgi:starch synthase (maltosyl-transferring)